MSERSDQELAREISQHKVRETLHRFQIDRRDFFKFLGGGVVVCVCVRKMLAQESGRARGAGAHELPGDIASWLHIAEDGRVTVYTGKVEMGQNIRTSLAQQVAEELRVPVGSITMVMGDTDLTPWDAGTFGSRTTPTMGPQLRTVAVAARTTLVEMAAQRWKLKPDTLVVSNGQVMNPQTKQTITYGELTHGQKIVRMIDDDPALTPAAQWQIAGTSVPKVDGRDFVTGKHQYPWDFRRPGMLHGEVLRPSGFHAKLISLDTSEADKLSGVKVVRDGDFVGVVASDNLMARQAVNALKAKWDVPPQPSNKDLFAYLKKNAEPGEDHGSSPGHDRKAAGMPTASWDVKLAGSYTVQYIAHAPLEPRAAVAEWQGNKLTVWTGSQRPFAIRDELADAFHVAPEKVRVLIPDTGSAYGGKHTGDAATEAARLARAAGKPVKVAWTREEEFTWAYFRPAGLIEVQSGARKDGVITAWEFHNYNSGPAGIDTPYNIANRVVQFHPVQSPLRQGSYRALAATANNFARETHMDELAHALNMDPLQFRLKNISDDRLRAVLQAAADKFGWAKQKPVPGSGFGIAGGFEKGGHVATCVEVTIAPATRKLRITRVVQAFECGAVVNPDGLRNQIEGAMVQGLGGALFEAVQFENGRILNPRFSQYRVPRFTDVPEIEIVVLDRKDLPSAGAGETPILGVAPAIGNAIFSATGTRLRHLPLIPEGIVPNASAQA